MEASIGRNDKTRPNSFPERGFMEIGVRNDWAGPCRFTVCISAKGRNGRAEIEEE